MRKFLLSALLAAALVPGLAAAQASFGLRASYAVPRGDAYDQSGFGGTITQRGLARRMVPIQLDAAWRFSPAFSAGVYYAYGFFADAGADLQALCASPGSSCDGPNVSSFGAQAAWAFSSHGRADPWVGLSAGLEVASFKVRQFNFNDTPVDMQATLRGWETALAGGVDHRFSGTVVGGPFLSFGVGQYTVEHVTLADRGTVAGGGVTSPKLHQWLTLGVRGRYDV
jgi:hypothetical protein